ncbi:carboxypeptidase regulatory-like domain-containing protein [Streptomyces sp. NPDC059787]|uniref:carboxypeptidase regulatory-like domain-containing protein n=1 Tax=Streptomyces sp. NPDC059787 TaxID=3346947 RepID=UPI003657CFB7
MTSPLSRRSLGRLAAASLVSAGLGVQTRAHAATTAQSNLAEIVPVEYSGALRNPLMGLVAKDFFVNTTDPDCAEDQPFDYMPWATMMMTYIPWDHLEDDEDDGVDKIAAYLDQRWRGKDANGVWRSYEEYGIKVIPRLYLRFPAETSGNTGSFYGLGGDHWPADLAAGNFTSAAFDARLQRMIQRLGTLWDDDPRVAYVQMGIFGLWGEQHGTAQPPNLETYFNQYFTNKHVQVRYYDKGMWADYSQFGHYNDSIGDLITAPNWDSKPIGGEPAYDYNGFAVHGVNTRETCGDEDYCNNTANLARSAHAVYYTWVGDYSYGSRWTSFDAEGGREAYLANKAAIDIGAEKIQKALGYRYVISSFSYPKRIDPGVPFDVSFTVKNTGAAPMYYNWPVQVSLKNPATGEIVWSDTFANTDITAWQPGSGYPAFDKKKNGTWSEAVAEYTTAPAEHTETGTFTLPTTVANRKTYVIQLAVLDPAGNVPSLRFAMQNYTQGGYHPMGQVGVGKTPSSTTIDPSHFDDPAVDVGLRYYRPGQTVAASSATLETLEISGAPLLVAENGDSYDLENLLLAGTDTRTYPHCLDAATVSWRIASGSSHATLSGSILTPGSVGTGTIVATLNGVTSEPFAFEVSDQLGSISGTVTASYGSLLAAVDVSIASASRTYTTTTDVNGSFVFNNVFADSYTVTASKTNFTDAVIEDVTVQKGSTVSTDLTLELVTGGNFFDDFSSGAGNWTAGTGAWSVSNGIYHQTTVGGSNSWRYASTITGKVWQDATYEADISYDGSGQNWAAILFRKPAQGDTINTGGYFVDWQYSGKIELGRGAASVVILASATRATDWSTSHHLRVVTQGSNIKVYVDDETSPVIDVNDSTSPYGYAGVGASGATWGFDNVRVTEA